MQGQYNADLEEALMDWIEDVTGYAIDSFHANLKSGTCISFLYIYSKPGTTQSGSVYQL
jgi:hypothetical protein